MRSVLLTLFIGVAFLVACSPSAGTGAPPTAPSATQTSAATAPAPVADEAAVDGANVVYGRTDEGAYFHGAADAPVTLTDYSDFL